jgi:predicted RND superfamily exporter protein
MSGKSNQVISEEAELSLITKVGMALTRSSIERPSVVIWTTGLLVAALIMLVLLPSLWPQTFSPLQPMRIDTDPENMLQEDEQVRVFHNQMKDTMSLHDLVVVGVENTGHPEGVFNKDSLGKIHELARFAGTLQWPAKDGVSPPVGVIESDLIAPSTIDNIEQAGPGSVRFEWMMQKPPASDEEALEIREKILRIPFLEGTLISNDGRSVILYLPVTSKDISWRVQQSLKDKIAELEGPETYHITGMPVAQDAFGVEMFIQMAIVAPAAMGLIFVLLFLFFRNLTLIAAPMIVCMAACIATITLLVITGNTVHIMSSMIPIFIMPIAVLDSVHVLSEFFDRYPFSRDRKKTIVKVMRELFTPMLFTSITTSAAFASLALTPIPPVQVFGIFVAFGVMLAWFVTITLVPAYICFVPKHLILKICKGRSANVKPTDYPMGRFLSGTSRLVRKSSMPIIALSMVALVVGAYGISKLQVNDNPIRWFTKDHPIRVSDTVLNKQFGGTYMAYLTLSTSQAVENSDVYSSSLISRLTDAAQGVDSADESAAHAYERMIKAVEELAVKPGTKQSLLDDLETFISGQERVSPAAESETWDALYGLIDQERVADMVFKDPAVLTWMEGLQGFLEEKNGAVGKTSSVVDIVKTVHRELREGRDKEYRVPDSRGGVAETLITFQNGHRAHDIWHFVTPDYQRATLWLQLHSGDNLDMQSVIGMVDSYISLTPPPVALQHEWFGLTYINMVWQDLMVNGMRDALVSSFLVVFVFMVVLFRSLLWGLLAMLPLTVAIVLIYGIIGLIGKDYDMPVAVLSSLALGLAVDFAQRYERGGTLQNAVTYTFGEPAIAIARNALIISIGFLPLLAAPLVPYNTVGILIASILVLSAIATIVILPSLLEMFGPQLVKSLTQNPEPEAESETAVKGVNIMETGE